MRTVGASLPGRLGASLLAVILCALMVLPAQAITANYPHFTPAVPVPEKTAYRGVFESDAQAYTGIFAWAERAKTCGMPERFAQEALGHNSKAVHRAYAKRALMKIPSLEDYERQAAV